MSATKTVTALAMGLLTTLSVATFAQNGQDQPSGNAPTLVLDELATIDWIEKSDVAALREGVIDKVELKMGMPVLEKGLIGTLHKEAAELTVAKNKVLADATGAIEKGKAQIEVAASRVARNHRLNARKPGMVSAEDMAKDEGELKVADAMTKEAKEQQAAARAELRPGRADSRGAHDPLSLRWRRDQGVEDTPARACGPTRRSSRLASSRSCAPMPMCRSITLFAVKEGQEVVIQPRIISNRGEPLPIEKKRFRGKITFVDPQIQAIAETAVRIRAEFDNPGFDLRPGLKVQMTIYLNADVASRVPPPVTQ